MKAIARRNASARHARAAAGNDNAKWERLGMTIILLSCALVGTGLAVLGYHALKWAGVVA